MTCVHEYVVLQKREERKVTDVEMMSMLVNELMTSSLLTKVAIPGRKTKVDEMIVDVEGNK